MCAKSAVKGYRAFAISNENIPVFAMKKVFGKRQVSVVVRERKNISIERCRRFVRDHNTNTFSCVYIYIHMLSKTHVCAKVTKTVNVEEQSGVAST